MRNDYNTRVFEALSIALFYGTTPEFKLTDFE